MLLPLIDRHGSQDCGSTLGTLLLDQVRRVSPLGVSWNMVALHYDDIEKMLTRRACLMPNEYGLRWLKLASAEDFAPVPWQFYKSIDSPL